MAVLQVFPRSWGDQMAGNSGEGGVKRSGKRCKPTTPPDHARCIRALAPVPANLYLLWRANPPPLGRALVTGKPARFTLSVRYC